jgi:hypothetical protein
VELSPSTGGQEKGKKKMSDIGKFGRTLEALNERKDWREAMTEDEESAVLEALNIA